MITEINKIDYISPRLELSKATAATAPLCASGTEVNPGIHVNNYSYGETF